MISIIIPVFNEEANLAWHHKKITEYLATLLRSQKRMELHGIVHDGYTPCVRVLKAAEERSLQQIG